MKICQSCGMPLKQDPKQGGTNKDGSKSEKYCSYCYQQGKFMDSFQTPQEMQKLCIEKMTEQGTPKFLAWLFTRITPRLERWQS